MKSKLKLSLAKLGRGMKRRNGIRMLALSVILTAMMAAGLVVGLRGSKAQSTGQPSSPPDYSKVNDVLNGADHLLRNDDLVITYTYPGPNNTRRNALLSAGTFDSTSQPANVRNIVPAGQANCGSSTGCQYDYYSYPGNSDPASSGNVPATGRFFNTDRDTTVHYPFQISNVYAPLLVSLAGKTESIGGVATFSWSSAQNIQFVGGASSFLSTVADFNGDGYDDLLMGYSNPLSTNAAPKMRIATAIDVNNPQAGFKFGPEFSLSNPYGIREMTAGDFDGDRQPEIASLYVDTDSNLYLATYRVDPKTLAISEGGNGLLGSAVSVGTFPLQIVAGRFSAVNHQQLVVGQSDLGNDVFGTRIRFFSLDFYENSIQPKLISHTDTYVGTRYDGSFRGRETRRNLKLKPARFYWGDPTDRIVMMTSAISFLDEFFSESPGTLVSVLTVDPQTLQISMSNATITLTQIPDDGDGGVFWGKDIAIGSFDHQAPTQADPARKERDPALQIAVIGTSLANDGSTTVGFLKIYDVPRDLSALPLKSSSRLAGATVDNRPLNGLSLATADLQGRSFRLGPGYKITVDRAQPSVILAAPPMHADYAIPAGKMAPTVLNLSLAPENFHSEYEQSDSSNSSTTSKSTTSMTFSGEESLSGSVTLGTFSPGGELENGVKITDTFKAKQEIKNSTETINGSFQSTEFEVTQETGLSDVVWFKDTSYYLYVYPVIGRKVCPTDKPNCQESEKNPLRIMFSAPKETSVQRLASDTLEWYQPPWEYGNLFSYPAGLAQLKLYIPDLFLLTQAKAVFATDDANATLKTTWVNGKTTGQNIEHEAVFSEENDLSIEGKHSIKVFGIGGSGSLGLEVNLGGSNGTKSLSESETQIKSATGITIAKSAAFPDPFSYKYFFSPYIFGKNKPGGFTDEITSAADLQSFGAIRSAFTVDPLGNGNNLSGGWWSQSAYKQLPDVAINHPNRWVLSSQFLTNPVPVNCVGSQGKGNMQCVTPTEREPANPWLDPFHDMRGLFITNAITPLNPNPLLPRGAQQQTATVGDKMSLQTRVYNYSFKAMPAGTKVKARFYGMEWNEQTNSPAKPDGESFLIGEDTLNPIPPFDNSPAAPLNWVLAGATFDTTPYENKSLVFWVAVWMQDANGNLVPEIAAHGLTGVPQGSQPGSKVTFEDVAKLEQMVTNLLKTTSADPDMASFSNNIGFYRFVFSVTPKTVASAIAASGPAEVKVEQVNVAAASIKPGQSVEAFALLRNGAHELSDVTVYFYDGDPQAGGRLVDLERLGRLRAGGQHKVSIRFRPRDCGSHRIFVKVAQGKAHEASGQSSQTVQVECPVPVCVSQVCMRSAQYHSLNLNRLPQGMVTIAGRGLDSKVSTSDTARMKLLLQGGASRQQQLNQQYVATQLSLLAQPGGNQAALRSNLLCYKLNFQPVQLSSGATLNPSMTLGELFDQVRLAGNSGKVIDQRLLANLLQMLNGDDPQGRCR